MGALRIRPLEVGDEEQARVAHAELAADGFEFLFIDADEPFAAHVAKLGRESRGDDLPAGRVPATFLVGEADGELVGRVSVRHALNAGLARYGGHVGYGVRPAFRGRGYATALLRHGLNLLAGLGVPSALVSCDDDNPASAAVIERCGGVLRDVVPGEEGDDAPKRRYDVPTRHR